MRAYKEVQRKVLQLETITCDVCKRVFNSGVDDMQIQEMVSINFDGGYESIFGDCATIKCDICQHCLSEKLGEYLIIE